MKRLVGRQEAGGQRLQTAMLTAAMGNCYQNEKLCQLNSPVKNLIAWMLFNYDWINYDWTRLAWVKLLVFCQPFCSLNGTWCSMKWESRGTGLWQTHFTWKYLSFQKWIYSACKHFWEQVRVQMVCAKEVQILIANIWSFCSLIKVCPHWCSRIFFPGTLFCIYEHLNKRKLMRHSKEQTLPVKNIDLLNRLVLLRRAFW